nr:FAD-binding oxidoreductase [Burkholderia ubonensis]
MLASGACRARARSRRPRDRGRSSGRTHGACATAPCTPDMRPVIGPAPRHPRLWFAFGHCYHGLTLGPATGRLLAEMMTGAPTYIDPHPYRPARFG